MPIPAGNFGNPDAAPITWEEFGPLSSWVPLLIGIGGLAFMYWLGKKAGDKGARAGTSGLGHFDPRSGHIPTGIPNFHPNVLQTPWQ